MNYSETISELIKIINDALAKEVFVRIIISNKRNKSCEFRSINIKPAMIKTGPVLSFVYRYPTQDLTKNYNYQEGLQLIKEELINNFNQAELFTTKQNWHLFINKKKKGKLSISAATITDSPLLTHDKQKVRKIDSSRSYFIDLGVTDANGRVKPSMQDKYRQINKYIEIIEGILKSLPVSDSIKVTDMGSGKGYLTFALYDYLQSSLQLKANVTGVEFRKELVDKCNKIAKNAEFHNLQFIEGSIEKAPLERPDMLIALHACDTATDEAIYRGIKAEAKIIICAPCCHKQIRKQVKPENELGIISQYGILLERQAEILTDTIRSQILEAYGYKTKVFEFISTEHTPKNVMIAGTLKKPKAVPDQNIFNRIAEIKKLYGIENHHLEKLLNINLRIT
jgi:SAM-dependent methyltransferase